MASTNARAIVSGTLAYLGGALAALLATLGANLVFGSILPTWVPVDLLAGLVALVIATFWIARHIGLTSMQHRLILLVTAFWMSGLVGSLLWALLTGSSALQGFVYALTFGILRPSSTGPALLGLHWTFGLPSPGIFFVLAAGLFPPRRKHPHEAAVGVHRTSTST